MLSRSFTGPSNQQGCRSTHSSQVTPYASSATYNLNTDRSRQVGLHRAAFTPSSPVHTKGNGVEDGNPVGRKQHAQPMRPRPAPKPKPAQIRPKRPCVKALYNYEPQDTDELGFQAGQLIELLEKGRIQTIFGEYLHACPTSINALQPILDGGVVKLAKELDFSLTTTSRQSSSIM